MQLRSPYRNTKEYTKISLEPYYMNSDIKNNIKTVLKKKVERNCNKNGYVDEVLRIIEYSDGFMPAENLNGNAHFNITYHCKICNPIENTIIIGHIKVINQELVVAINGPIMIFIPKEYVDTTIWEISDKYINKITNVKLEVGNYVKIHVMVKRNNQNDTQIKIMGKLLEIATEEEVAKYFGSKIVIEKKEDPVINENVGDTENTTSDSNFIT